MVDIPLKISNEKPRKSGSAYSTLLEVTLRVKHAVGRLGFELLLFVPYAKPQAFFYCSTFLVNALVSALYCSREWGLQGESFRKRCRIWERRPGRQILLVPVWADDYI